MIIVQDILPAIQRATGQNSQPVLYEYLNRAIQTLSKIQPQDKTLPCWDASLIYVNLPIQNPPGNIITLPYEIDRPVKVNVDLTPSFSRTRLFEFTLNGPGSSTLESGWQWQDRGLVAYQGAPWIVPSTIAIASSAGSSDAGTIISAVITVADPNNLSSSTFIEQEVTWTLGGSGTLTTSQIVADIRQIYKPTTAGTITLTLTNGGTLIGAYPAWMTHPEYATIKVSQSGYSARILARRKHWQVSVPTDFIPLSDQMAVIMATQWIKLMEELQYTIAGPVFAQASMLLENDQAIKMSFAAVAAASEVQTPLNLDIIARDVIQVNDIYDEWCTISGQVGQLKVFDSMTEAIEVLANKSEWDPLIGYVDILVQNLYGPYVTLPREVETPLAININGRPGPFRSKWFEFNMNGEGEAEFYQLNSLVQIPNQTKRLDIGWDDAGEVVVAFDPIPPGGSLLAWAFSPADIGSQVTVYGADVNMNPLVQTLTATNNYALATGPLFCHIWRVTLSPGRQGFIGLLISDGVQDIQTLGTYFPQDIEPRYSRIKLMLGPQQMQPVRIRMRYRRRWSKISSLTDVIPLKSRSALTMMARYLIQIKSGQDVQMFAENMLQQATDLANADWRRANPREVLQPQFDPTTFGAHFHSVY